MGISLIVREVLFGKFSNFFTSIFLICFVPLFCLYPVIARYAVGGALPVESTLPSPLDDPYSYAVYQLCCQCIIVPCILINRKKSQKIVDAIYRDDSQLSPKSIYILLAILSIGIYLYIYSTGLSASELLVASRFSWFNNSNYSSSFVIL